MRRRHKQRTSPDGPRADVLYVTLDQITTGVGRSQVSKYVSALSRMGHRIELHSFETEEPSGLDRTRLSELGVMWVPHAFGRPGLVGGLARVVRLAHALRSTTGLVHARSDLSFLAAALSRSNRILWDVRSFWADQRVALGEMRAGGLTYRFFRRLEKFAAHRSTAIITLTSSAASALADEHPSADVPTKTTVVSTCTDLDAYQLLDMPAMPPYRFLLAGTLNVYYDTPLMMAFVSAMSEFTPVDLRVLAPPSSHWAPYLEQRGLDVSFVSPEQVPFEVAASHAGLSVCKLDAGRSLAAAMPTKLGEFLATGRPVVVNKGLGDMDQIIDRFECGVTVESGASRHLREAASRLWELANDLDLSARCRLAAESEFSLESGVQRISAIYDSLDSRRNETSHE